MNAFKLIFVLLFSMLYSIGMNAQNTTSQCERYVQKKKIAKAIICYEEALIKKPKNIRALCRLTELYYAKKDEANTRKYAKKAVEINANEAYNPLYYLARKMSFKRDNVQAVYILDLLANRVSDETKKTKLEALKSNYLLQKYELSQARYNVLLQNLGDSINSTEAEYLPSLSLDGNSMVFTRRVNGVNEDFFIALKDSNGVWGEAVNLGYPPNTGYPDGAAKLSADGNYLFFTRCDMRSPNGIERGGCDLVFCYRTGLKDGKIQWSAPQYFKFTINTPAYEGQPCLSSDNKDLYFVSDRADGIGGKDIYVSHFENDYWTEPENLGPQINTAGDETTPFIHPDNETLYFASNGHPTMGDADVFVSRRIVGNQWRKAINLGAPINTDKKDGGVAISAKGDIGYIATERAGSRGKLDIYSFELYKGIRPISTLCMKGKVFNKKSKDLLKEESVHFYELPSKRELATIETNKGDASYTQALHLGKQYLMSVVRPGYKPFYKTLDLRKDTFANTLYQDAKLKIPGWIDTLGEYKLLLDSTKQLSKSALIKWNEIKQKIPNWLADSSQVKLYFKVYYYYGDSDTDTLAYKNFDNNLRLVNTMRQELKAIHFPQTHSIMRSSPYIWRDEADDLNYIELKFVEFY